MQRLKLLNSLAAMKLLANEELEEVIALLLQIDQLQAGDIPLETPMTLKGIREFRGLTQTQLGEKTGIAQGYIALLENNKREGTLSTMKKLANALDVPLDLIL
jgi:DNA-binding XRE family transcriptional regulator